MLIEVQVAVKSVLLTRVFCLQILFETIQNSEKNGLRIESFAVINLRGVSTNKIIIIQNSIKTPICGRLHTLVHCAFRIHDER